MKVAVISTFDTLGGAARAAYRLHKGLCRTGIHSVMLVKEKHSQDETVRQINPVLDRDTSRELEIFDAIRKDYINAGKNDASSGRFSPGYPGFQLQNTTIVDEADVISLHWVDEFQSSESVAALAKTGKPVVWTLHDQNPFTGGCHYSAGCTLYTENCRPCPQLNDDPFSLPYFNLQNKIRLLQDKNITVVTPSRWLADTARQSMVFGNSRVETIANSIETDVFCPRDKSEAKRESGIPGDTVTILTGASRRKPSRKGFIPFFSAMKHCLGNKNFKGLVETKKLLLSGFGNAAAEITGLGIPYLSFGNVRSDTKLADIYNAADIFVLPSTEDNLPNTMVEAMACGTPVIAFDTGGMPDMIRDGITGRLVPAGHTQALAQAILQLVFDPSARNRMGQESRQLIERNYKLEHQARKYADLFMKLLPHPCSSPHDFISREKENCTLDSSFNSMLSPLYRKYADCLRRPCRGPNF